MYKKIIDKVKKVPREEGVKKDNTYYESTNNKKRTSTKVQTLIKESYVRMSTLTI